MMNNEGSLQKILIYPCRGNCSAGRLTSWATQELILQGKAEWLIVDAAEWSEEILKSAINGRPFIVVDGCERECGKKYFESAGWSFEFHLSLADLAIEKDGDWWSTGEELQLVKDAIVAESTRVSKKPPVMPMICWCR